MRPEFKSPGLRERRGLLTAIPRSRVRLFLVSVRGEAPVRPEPGGQAAPPGAGRGLLRASHADREQVIDVLKTAFVQGRLTKDEFDTRVGQTFTSRTYAT